MTVYACRIGCDGCGVYPIVGKRYRCRDCHERIGFDLCSACHDSNRDMAGRFNQQHRPGELGRSISACTIGGTATFCWLTGVSSCTVSAFAELSSCMQVTSWSWCTIHPPCCTFCRCAGWHPAQPCRAAASLYDAAELFAIAHTHVSACRHLARPLAFSDTGASGSGYPAQHTPEHIVSSAFRPQTRRWTLSS